MEAVFDKAYIDSCNSSPWLTALIVPVNMSMSMALDDRSERVYVMFCGDSKAKDNCCKENVKIIAMAIDLNNGWWIMLFSIV